jgi:hypothetical protein
LILQGFLDLQASGSLQLVTIWSHKA